VLKDTDRQVVLMPQNARILCVMNQQGSVTMWAEVDTTSVIKGRVFQIVGTGIPMPEVELTYIGSVQQPPFVWHVYEED
jgi:hypothetical protein